MSHRSSDVVVVGAGIMGLMIAYQIARRSDLAVTVVEKGPNVAEGSTGASCAILRQRYSHAPSIRMARDGLAVYRNWPEFTGLAEPRARFVRTGVLWMLGEDAASVERWRRLMSGLGIDVSSLSGAEVRRRFPALSTCSAPFDLTGVVEHECVSHDTFLFEDGGGYFDPVGAAQDLLEAARREGVEVRFRTEVTGVRVTGGRVQGVDLGDGSSLGSPIVVNAAGPWASRLLAMAGLDCPWTLRPIRVQVVYRDWPAEVPGPLPVVADAAGGVYFRPATGNQQILMGSIRAEDEQEVVDPDDFRPNIDAAWRDVKIHALHHRIPSLPHRGMVTGIAGLYTVNVEDVHAVIGPTPLEGFVVANGFSGHGFKEAPAVGAMVASHLTGTTAPMDTDAPMEFFAFDRAPIPMDEKAVLA